MGMSTGGDGGYASEINITPLVDVVLVLLIIFMVIAPVMLRGYDVAVPGETVVASTDNRIEQVVLTIDENACPILDPVAEPGLPAGCTVKVNDESLPVRDLPAKLAATYADRPRGERVLFLAAHDQLNYEGVLRILDAAKSGVEELEIGIVTE